MRNHFYHIFALIIGVSVFGVAVTAEARSAIRVDETVSVSDEQVVPGDFYGAGSTVSLSGAILGDAHIVGGRVTLNGSVASDTLAVAVSADLHGDIGDDIRIIAGDVTVASHVKGDLVVFARRLELLSTAQVDGDVIFFGQEAEILGAVGNDIMGTMTTLRLDGPVGGEVDVAVGFLTVGDNANVTGALQYASGQELVRAPNAVLSGTVVRNEVANAASAKGALQSLLKIILPLLFAVLCWHLLIRASLEQLVRGATTNYLRAAVIGFAVVVGLPVAAVILMISGLGAVLGWILLIFYLGLLCTAIVGAVAVGGGFARMLLMPKSAFGLPWLLVGALLMALLFLFPYGGVVLLFLLVIVTLGALAERIFYAVR